MSTRALAIVGVMLAACAAPADRREAVRADTATLAGRSPAAPAMAARQVAPARAEQDSVRGVIESVGNEPLTQLILRQRDGATCAVQAAPGVLSASVAGLEVTLWGRRSTSAPRTLPGATCTFNATRYSVRAADGVATVDGVLRAVGAQYFLELASGERLALRDVPAVLRRRVDARVFWAGPLDRAPSAYGVLQEARP